MSSPQVNPGGLDEGHRLLLAVCHLPADEAGALWDGRVADRLSIDDLAGGAQDLIPLLHRRLVELDRRVSDLERMRGVRRRTLVRNQRRLKPAAEVLALLRSAGIAGALVGGAAVAAGHGHLDLRPVHDVDLLVGPAEAGPAAEVLRRAGWRPGPRWRDGALLDVHGAAHVPPDGSTGLLLRWSAAPPYDDAVALGRAVTIAGDDLRVVDPADLLVQTILDGERPAMPRSPRWASDALTVLGAAGDDEPLDWERVTDAATRRGRRHALLDGLLVLDGLVPFGLPDDVVRSLEADRPGRWARRLDRDPVARPGVVGALARRATADGLLGATRSVPDLVRLAWDGRRPAVAVPRDGRRP